MLNRYLNPSDLVSAQNAATQTHQQRFTITYEFPVVFTRDLFAAENPVFAETLSRQEPERRHKIAVLIDDGLRSAHEMLPQRIQDYAAAHELTMELVAVPSFERGGEGCKNDPALVEALQRRLVEMGLDRHSFVAAIGGGAFLDLVG